MSGGFFALLDDIVAMAKLAAASIDDVGAAAGRASAKAAGVVIDDTAVTPRYVHGFSPERELPVIRKIAAGSLRNKLLFILPAALLLSQFLPWLLTPILMIGGTYLCYEGAEKVWERFGGHGEHEPAPVVGGPDEKVMVAGAIRTDFILSAEIMVIALNEVAAEPLLSRTFTLIIVALVMTLVVYGVVAVIVKMDDVGLHLATERTGALAALGRGLVAAMPKVLGTLSAVGIVAMLWVGGHILLVGLNDLGWHPLYELVHHAEEAVAHAIPGFLGATLAWLLNTAASAVLGLVAGAIVVAVMHLVQRLRGGGHQPGHPAGEEPAHPGETAGTPRADQPPDAVGHEPGREGEEPGREGEGPGR
ncbi:MAG TPA: DUF808 domain-containing protein [Micropruina sp.]|nr:DUF808 domain-containing protein [Micropruina sp.]